MAKAFKYMLGMWTGASMVAFGAACGMLYFLTGKLPVMTRGRPRLVAVGEAIARTRALIEKAIKSNEPILKQGVVVGILAPLAFLTGVIYWVYRFTGQIPFPVRRPVEGEVTIRLVDPVEVPAYWQQWKKELEPILDQYRALVEECKTRYASR